MFDNGWVVIGDGSALHVYAPDVAKPEQTRDAESVKTVSFHDGFVSWNTVEHGGSRRTASRLWRQVRTQR